MDISVKKNTKYVELIIKDGSTTIETGLMDERETRIMACELIEVAAELLNNLP
jgi:hypothetical protein